MISTSYCGSPPEPGGLWERFNLDPVLIIALAGLVAVHLHHVRAEHSKWVLGGWAIAAFAFISPLCALSVSLFSARVGQHMVLVLLAAPLIAFGLPRSNEASGRDLLLSSLAFALPLWLWHMPTPYAATFRSDAIYWAMHVSLFGGAILLWRDLLHHRAEGGLAVLVAGLAASVQMGLLGAILTFVPTALFRVHYLTTSDWGMSPLADQQLGGLIMWVPGLLLFLVAAKRSLDILLGTAPATR